MKSEETIKQVGIPVRSHRLSKHGAFYVEYGELLLVTANLDPFY